MAKKKTRGQRAREKVDCTVAARAINGEEWDEETGQKVVHYRGEDVKLSHDLAHRLNGSGRVVIDPEDRKRIKASQKRADAEAKKAEKAAEKNGGAGAAK